ncbi:flagellar basal body-associated FliL family protein [Salipiger abyssi]|uniref:flagellar basal body-associated FliL family protein n=1 Tax=Salipiger abyssi TaxID=1250539 RepID=UPI0040581D74
MNIARISATPVPPRTESRRHPSDFRLSRIACTSVSAYVEIFPKNKHNCSCSSRTSSGFILALIQFLAHCDTRLGRVKKLQFMADSSKTSPSDAAPGKAGRLIRIAVLLVVCLLALAGGLVAAVGPQRVMALLSGGNKTAAPDEAHATEAAAHGGGDTGGHGAEAQKNIVVTPFKEIIVNITSTTATGRQTTRFLKLNLALAYDSRIAGAENIEERKLFLRDSFQDYLRQLNESDLQGTVGLVRLKSELLRRARAISDSAAPQEFLIADLIVQ